MCGINGFTGKYNREILTRMNASLIHRGPDDGGFYHDADVGLAMRRLSIIDVKNGHQPISNQDNSIWTVFNGEIYNFQEIRRDLEKKGYRFKTDHSDTEVIVHAYQEYGPKFVEHLNGMFAIAIWDKHKKELYLYRDRLGEKPLYFWRKNNNLFFSSEIKGLLSIPFFNKKLNEKALFYYLGFKNTPRQESFFVGVESLGPGEYLKWKNGKITRKIYWEIDAGRTLKISEEEAASEIRRLLKDSVKHRMISDVPLGAYLSGGVDSSAIVGYMSRERKKAIDTFALTYSDSLQNKAQDEFWAARMAQKFKTKHREYRMGATEYISDLDKVLDAFDEPFGGTISTFFLSKLIRKHVTVAVSGDGADELFGSYKIHRLAYPMQAFADYRRKGLNLDQLSSSQLRKLVPFDQDINFLKKLKGASPAAWHAQLQVYSDSEKRELFSSKLNRKTEGLSAYKYYKKAYARSNSSDVLNQVLQVECQNLLADHVLAFVDRLSMAHSIEVRPPFLDHRLVEFAFRLPGKFKINHGVNKYILKKSLSKMLPQKLLHRPKEGFILPYHFWMQKYLYAKIDKTLSLKQLGQHGCFDIKSVRGQVERFGCGDFRETNKVLLLYLFQIWWNRHFS